MKSFTFLVFCICSTDVLLGRTDELFSPCLNGIGDCSIPFWRMIKSPFYLIQIEITLVENLLLRSFGVLLDLIPLRTTRYLL
jgi:hypothetical protein